MKNTLLILIAFACNVFFLHAQTVSGIVTGSDTRDGLPQVNVVVKGTTTGTVTDLEGRFTITLPEGNKILVFTFVGYSEKEMDVSGISGEINVVLSPADIGLNPVVVSASKTSEKILDAPASVTVITSERIQSQSSTTVVDNLRTTPGVDIMTTGLISSNVNVRGFNNIFSGALLTIVDNRIARVPSLRLNAYQLIPGNSYDIDRIELVRGPGSALYGPNAADGVLAIFTKSPLDMEKDFETNISISTGLRGNSGADPRYRADDPATHIYYRGEDENAANRGFIMPEIRHAGKISPKVGYKISGHYLGGNDWRYYDPEEPLVGDTIIFGTVREGRLFEVDTTRDPQTFDRRFDIRKYNGDGRLDIRFNKDVGLILTGGLAVTSNLELTGLGAAQGENWIYSYAQARFNWKKLFIQYFLNSSNAGETYLIPRVSGAEAPHNVQLLIDKSKLHVWQVQHSATAIENKLNFIYGVDVLFTNPNTGGTIHGRFEDDDNIIQSGGYVQGEWNINRKLTGVGAFRLDWQDDVGTQFSPRAALVYKATPRNTLRATYNRAFSSPTALNQSLDLSNGVIPNGINIRGIGNRNGYRYRFDDNELPMFNSPYDNQWYSIGDRNSNHTFFDGMVEIISAGLAQSTGFPAATVAGIVNSLLAGIKDSTGTIMNVNHVPIDYVKFVNSGNFAGSAFSADALRNFQNFGGVDNQVTQTWELGYKGILFDKLLLTADFYYTRISDYVSPLTVSTASVMFNPAEILTAIGGFEPGGLLYDNLQPLDGILSGLLDGNPAYQDPTGTIPSLPGTAWDEIAFILSAASSRIPIGSATPDDPNVQSDVILTYINLGTIDVGGMDVGFTYLINDKWSVLGGYSYVTRDRIDLEGAQDGYVALNAPRHKTAFSIENKCKIGLTSRLSYRWRSGFPANSAVYVGDVEPMHFLDVSMSYKLPFSKQTVVTADIQNLLNKKYQQFPGTPFMGIMGILKIAHTF